MVAIYYLGLIPTVISALSCLIFLYFFIRYEAVRLLFLMKHVAILQFVDLIFSLANIIQVISYKPSVIYCQLISIGPSFLFTFQTYWTAVISSYIYKVVCLNKERSLIPIVRPALIGSICSMIPSIFSLCFECAKYRDDDCDFTCEVVAYVFVIYVSTGFFLCGMGYTCYCSIKVLKKLKNEIQTPSKMMKWTFARLFMYPFISFVCILPTFIYYMVYINVYGRSSVYLTVCFFFLNLAGLLNSIALGFTPEFKEALSFHKKVGTSLIRYS